MVGINLSVASQKTKHRPHSQTCEIEIRRFHSNRHQIIQTEVDNLLRVGFIREVKLGT